MQRFVILPSGTPVRFAHNVRIQEGIKKMIHLIWTKDNNTTTTEDGKEVKGVRQKLLECYKSLYFEHQEHLDPKAQINRIARNLIE